MAAIDEINEILRTRGEGLRLVDLDQIELLIVQMPIGEAAEAAPWIFEAVGLIVNAPEYTGDITPERLAA